MQWQSVGMTQVHFLKTCTLGTRLRLVNYKKTQNWTPIPQGSRLSNAKEYVEPPAFNAEKVRTFVP